MKTDEAESGVFVLWTYFLGTVAVLFGTISGYSQVRTGTFLGPGLFAVALLCLLTVGIAELIRSGVVVRIKTLKEGLDLLSNRLSGALFAGYGTAAIGVQIDLASGIATSIVVSGVAVALPWFIAWHKKRPKQKRTREHFSSPF
jgi:hypothetical protein